MRSNSKAIASTFAAVSFFLATQAEAQSMGTAPAWVKAMPVGTWAPASQNRLADVDPAKDPAANPVYPNMPQWTGNNGHACVIECWNGGAFATRLGAKGSLLAWGGGHKGYYGNEVYAFDMQTRLWTRLSNPYKTPAFPVTDGWWPDGSPAVPHTYAMVGYHAGTNSLVSMQTERDNAGGIVVPMLVFFDLSAKTWRRGPIAPSHIQYGGWGVYDLSRDTWWMEGGDSGGNFGRYAMNGTGTAGTWTMYPPKFNYLDAMAERDPVHDIIVTTHFERDADMYGIDLTNPGSAPVLLTQGGSPPTRSGRHGWEWSPIRQAFIYWRAGGDVYQVKLAGSNWKTGTWVWERLTAPDNGVIPADPSPGVYNRFRLATYDDAEVAVVVNSTTGPVYAFRLPDGVLVRPDPPGVFGAQ
jgi:hypothetical protein